MIRMRGPLTIAALVYLVNGCGGSHLVPRSSPQQNAKAMSGSANVLPPIPNLFAQALGKSLSVSDLDQYIDLSVHGADREKLRNLMAMLPPKMRGDVIYYDGTRAISNNPAVLPYVKTLPPETKGQVQQRHAQSQMSSRTRRPMVAGSCSPTDPYMGSGPYVREVGNCGFASGWGIVNLECNSSHFYANVDGFPNSADNKEGGYMYFEVTNTYTSPPTMSEGGIFTQYDISGENDIDPYITSNLGTIQNAGARYTCGTYIGIMSGLVLTGAGSQPNYYVATGTIAGYNPTGAWQSSETVTLSNAAWIFEAAPNTSSYYNWGVNSAGLQTPCMHCSISKVTSIADKGADLWDSSYFGVDQYTGQNAVYWPEIVFGVWSGCTSGGSSPPTGCTLQYSPDAHTWYAGQEIYPQPLGGAYPDAQSSFVQPAGAWVYQSYDSVTAAPAEVGPGSMRTAGAFLAPSPPPACTADSYGLCADNTAAYNTVSCQQLQWNPVLGKYVYMPSTRLANVVYAIYRANALQSVNTETRTIASLGCQDTSDSWSPAEPKVTYNDPNLP